ncbi:MAG: gliding motility-associated-like protein [Yoonia sp.]|jgi:gliding motility-associated-like protein
MKQLISFFVLLCGASIASGQSYFLQGDASFLGDDCYLLTPAINTQTGAVWYDQQLDLLEPFDLELSMNLGNQDVNGADGICFVLQTVGTNAIGQSGGGIGFLGFAPAFAVEFDTWQNGEYADPAFDHIAMISNGDVSHISENAITTPVQASALSQNIEDGIDHIVRLVWEPETLGFSVFFDCDLRVTTEIDLVAEIFDGQTTVWWGFTAGTGGANNNQSVCLQENIITASPDVQLCEGGSTILNAGGNTDGEFTWSPATYLDDPNSQSPVCTPEEDITYTVSYDDLCGNPVSTMVNVMVDLLEAQIEGDTFLNCYNPTLTLNGSNNFGNPSTYEWTTADGTILSGGNGTNVVIADAGTYDLLVTFDEQCDATTSIDVTADFTAFEAGIEVEGEINCIQTEVPLIGSTDGIDFLFEWDTQNGGSIGTIDNLNAVATSSGTYLLTIINPETGCESEASVNVTSNTSVPNIAIGIADSLSCENLTVEILGTFIDDENNSSIQWTTPDGTLVSGTNMLEPTVSDTGTYTITVTYNFNGCSSSASMEVFASEDQSLDVSSLSFPNIFTPNADGKNDVFKPFLADDTEFNILKYMPSYDLLIYNRWGGLIYESTGVGKQWDGKTNGEELSPGVYYFIVNYEITCGTAGTVEAKGEVELTR